MNSILEYLKQSAQLKACDLGYGLPPDSSMSYGSVEGPINERRRLLSTSTKARRRSSDRWRFLDRKGAFYQSLGLWRIKRIHRSLSLILEDPVHTILNTSLTSILVLFTICYLITILVFAQAWQLVSIQCELEIEHFSDAWYFSLETITK